MALHQLWYLIRNIKVVFIICLIERSPRERKERYNVNAIDLQINGSFFQLLEQAVIGIRSAQAILVRPVIDLRQKLVMLIQEFCVFIHFLIAFV